MKEAQRLIKPPNFLLAALRANITLAGIVAVARNDNSKLSIMFVQQCTRIGGFYSCDSFQSHM